MVAEREGVGVEREQGGDPCTHKARRGEGGREGGEIQGAMNDPCDFCLFLLHMRWNPWVQGDRRKLDVARGENKGAINETAVSGKYRFVGER